MAETSKPVPLRFWQSSQGREAVRDWLIELPSEDKRAVGRDISIVQLGWPIGLPVCRPLGSGLWEVRSSLPSKREARVLFCFHEGEIFALHAFIKKTSKTPQQDIFLAIKRMKEVCQ